MSVVKKAKSKTISQAMAEMMADGMKDFDPKNQPKIEAHNLYDVFKYKLTKETQNILMGIKTHSLLHERDEKVPTVVSPFLDFLEKTGNKGITKNIRDTYDRDYKRVFDKVMYLGRLATFNKMEEAATKVCNDLNRLAKKGYITASLAPLIGITLQRLSKREKPKIMVLSYVAVTREGEKYIEKKMKNSAFPEGGVPKKV